MKLKELFESEEVRVAFNITSKDIPTWINERSGVARGPAHLKESISVQSVVASYDVPSNLSIEQLDAIFTDVNKAMTETLLIATKNAIGKHS